MFQMKNYRVLIAALASGFVFTASAADLLQVYNQALKSDPTFTKAEADWQTAKMNFPLALTGSGVPGTGLFPNISGGVDYGTAYAQNVNIGTEGTFQPLEFSATITQPIFNLQTWQQIASASYSVKSATARYLAAAQSLMARTAIAYFEVLRFNDNLKYILAQKKEDLRQLETARQKFKVGLIAITGVYNAQASYDADIANEIGARNNLANQLENLRAITGVGYTQLNSLMEHLPLVVPAPSNIDAWVKTANAQNYLLKSDQFAMFQASKNIDAIAAGHLPVLTAVGSYVDSSNGALLGAGIVADTHFRNASGLLQLNVPITQGGYVLEATKQARYQYLSASDQLEIDHRTVVNQTRQSFLGVEAGISQIEADKEAIKSAQNQLAATRAGYIVGTRTMVDVLQSVTSLTQAQQAWANDRYDYVENIVRLKQQAGTLSPTDLVQMNRWLSSPIVFQTKQPPIKREKIQYPTVTSDVTALPPSSPLPTTVLPFDPPKPRSDVLPSTPSTPAPSSSMPPPATTVQNPSASLLPIPRATEPKLPSPV